MNNGGRYKNEQGIKGIGKKTKSCATLFRNNTISNNHSGGDDNNICPCHNKHNPNTLLADRELWEIGD